MPDQVVSILPAVLFLVPAAVGVLAYFIGRASITARNTVVLLGALATAAIALAMLQQMFALRAVLTTWGEELRVDALSMVLVLLIITWIITLTLLTLQFSL